MKIPPFCVREEKIMEKVLYIIAYFFVYSFIGWCLESIYKTILQKKLVNSGFLVGPFCPIYGFGALIMYLSLRNLTNNIFILFLFGLIVLSIFEYFVGLFLEVVFKTKYWDYSENKFNIHGRVCLKNSMYWGILGIIFMKMIHPRVEKFVNIVPILYVTIAIIVLMVIMFIDTVVTIIKLVNINNRLKKWSEITENIRARIDEINLRNAIRFENIRNSKYEHNFKLMKRIGEAKNRNELLGSLKEEQQRLQEKIEGRIERLKKAFPTMQSDKLLKFLNNMKKS